MACGNGVITCGVILLLLSVASDARVLLGPTPSGFIQTRNVHFVLNGSPFLFNGFNSYWLMNVAAQPSQRYKISNAFREARAAGLNVCRTWAFNDGGDQALQISPGVYSEPVFQVFFSFISCLLSTIIHRYNFLHIKSIRNLHKQNK